MSNSRSVKDPDEVGAVRPIVWEHDDRKVMMATDASWELACHSASSSDELEGHYCRYFHRDFFRRQRQHWTERKKVGSKTGRGWKERVGRGKEKEGRSEMVKKVLHPTSKKSSLLCASTETKIRVMYSGHIHTPGLMELTQGSCNSFLFTITIAFDTESG